MRHELKMAYYDVKDWMKAHVPAWLPTWLKLAFVCVVIGILASVCFGCVSEAQAAPRNAGVTVTVSADSATVTLTWTAPPGNYDGFAASLAMTGGPVTSRVLSKGVVSASFRVGKPLSDGQACVAATRSGKTGNQACADVVIHWPADPIPDVPIDTVVVIVDSVPSGPVDTTPRDTVVVVPPDTTAVQSSFAQLPTDSVDVRMPTPLRSYRIGANLQAALDTVKRGDRVLLPSGVTYTGNFVLRAKPGTGWIILQSDAPLPAPGTRVTPSTAADFAVIVTPNTEAALRTALDPGASYYRLVGLNVTSTAAMTYAVLSVGNPATHSLDSVPTGIIIDRSYVHGSKTLETQRCVALNSARSAVIDSWLDECHSSDFDSQAIGIFASPGPLLIANNYLAGSGENILVGGSDPVIQGLVTHDIIVRGNYITKPAAWATDTISPKGRLWAVKNLFELKNSRRVLVEDNILDGNWQSGQTGIGIVLKSSNQSGRCYWCVSEQVTVRWNWLRNSPGGFSLHRLDDYNNGKVVNGDTLGGGIPMHHVAITDNLITGVATHLGTRRQFQITGAQHLDIERNTSLDPAASHAVMWDGTPSDSLIFRDNLMAHGSYGVFGSGYGEGKNAIAHYMPGGIFTGNVIVGTFASYQYPSGDGNSYPTALPTTPTAGVDQVELMRRLQGVAP